MKLRRSLAAAGVAGVVTLAASPTGALPPPVSFAPAVAYATGGSGGPSPHGHSLAAADFDGDGAPDLAVANYGGNGIKILFNTGIGAFTTPSVNVPVAAFVGTLAAGDLDADGDEDLVATNAQRVYVLLNDGGGDLVVTSSVPLTQGGQEDMVVADFDTDGDLDVAVQLRYGVQVLRGDGNGNLDAGVLTPVPSPTISGLAAAHLDGDAIPALLVSDAGAQLVYPLLGDGGGSFTLTSAGATGFVPGTVLAGDLNGDAVDDAVTINEFSPTMNVAVLLSDGTGGLGLPTFYDGGNTPSTAGIGDLNGDGVPDVVSSDVVGSRLEVLLGDGGGGLVAGGSYPAATSTQTPVIADFDGDNRPDLAAGGIQSWFNPATIVTVLRNTTS